MLRRKWSGKDDKALEWLIRELLVKLKEKKEIPEACQVTWEDYRNTVHLYRGGVRKANVKS